MTAIVPTATANAHPVPYGRGQWRVTLHQRAWADGASPAETEIAELIDARSRHLEQSLNATATFTFSVSGRSTTATELLELGNDICAWRWNGYLGVDDLMFRGLITNSQDTLSEQTHTVALTCQDYSAVLGRRYLTAPLAFNQTSQDVIVQTLVGKATNVTSSSGHAFGASSYLPIHAVTVNPVGQITARPGGTVPLRDRAYPAQQSVYEAIDNLSQVINGFDWDVSPQSAQSASADLFRIFFPSRGGQKPDCPLIYGFNVAALTRTVASSGYANYVRVIGQAADENTEPPFSEAWEPSAEDLISNPAGLWMDAQSASDVTIQQTLDDQAQGAIANEGLIVPSYSLTLRPGRWDALRLASQPSGPQVPGIQIGDVVPLLVRSGRLDVNTTIRVVGITYDIGDDGDEAVTLTVGRPDTTFADLFVGADRRLGALERR